MRLATFLAPGSPAPRAGEVHDDHVAGYPSGTTVLDQLSSGGVAAATEEQWPLADVRLLAPIPRPAAIFGIGINYRTHAAETGWEPPPVPIVFMKTPSSSAAPGAPVPCPAVVHRLDYEGELAVVMGSGGEVAGYAVADDVSARDLQGREPQWTRAKGADGFCPWGPWITTADEVPEPGQLQLRTWVNGELRQDASTSDLIFGVPEIVAFITEVHALTPGELILTGTPSGVGMALDPPQFLASGDVVRIEIDRLGAIEHAIA